MLELIKLFLNIKKELKYQRDEIKHNRFLIEKLLLQNAWLQSAVGSRSQFFQDLFVLKQSRFKRGGFFVEFGATNGIDGSNTYLLEKEFGWSGILAEPAKIWHKQLLANRSATIETKCVWSHSGRILEFLEYDSPVLSKVSEFKTSQNGNLEADLPKKYPVETISLLDLLEKHAAPKSIDYLSIDTEGSEFKILSEFDFSKYDFQIITCEHNYGPQQAAIRDLMKSKGYFLVHDGWTDCDDWFVKNHEKMYSDSMGKL